MRPYAEVAQSIAAAIPITLQTSVQAAFLGRSMFSLRPRPLGLGNDTGCSRKVAGLLGWFHGKPAPGLPANGAPDAIGTSLRPLAPAPQHRWQSWSIDHKLTRDGSVAVG